METITFFESDNIEIVRSIGIATCAESNALERSNALDAFLALDVENDHDFFLSDNRWTFALNCTHRDVLFYRHTSRVCCVRFHFENNRHRSLVSFAFSSSFFSPFSSSFSSLNFNKNKRRINKRPVVCRSARARDTDS